MKMPLLRILLLPALALPLVGGPQQPRTIEELQKEINNLVVKNGVPGVGIVMVTPDRVLWAGGVGKADIAEGRQVTPDTLFRSGSISKSFVALALMKLQEEGRIDLDAKVKDLAPEIDIPNPWEATHPVRVAHLLEHTAGFDDWRWAGNLTEDATEIPLRGVMDLFPGRQRVRWLPGTRMVYSNHGYVVAGYLIEKITRQRFDDYIRSAVLNPLGMQRSRFGPTDANRTLLARGYNYRPLQPLPYRFGLQRPAGELLISPAEMGSFLQMWLNRGKVGGIQLFRPESLARVEEPRTSLAARMGMKSGYGLANQPMDAPGLRRRGHGGQIEGFLAFYVYMPEVRLAYAVFMNTWSPCLAEIDQLVGEYLTKGLPKAQSPPDAPTTDAELRRQEGVYLPADFRVHAGTWPQLLQRACRLSVEGGTLYQASLFGKGRERLIPAFPGAFRTRDELEPSILFSRSDDGQWAMTGSRGYFERVPAWRPYACAGGLLLAVLLMVSSVLYGLVWIPAKLLRRRVKHVAVRALPLGSVIVFVALFALMLRAADDPTASTRLDLPTLGYCLLSWLFPVLSFWALLLARRSFAYELRPTVRIHALLVSIACCGMATTLAYWGLLALRPFVS
jgi:CubicO group peptidase (beta-lactamase class C family)